MELVVLVELVMVMEVLEYSLLLQELLLIGLEAVVEAVPKALQF